MTEAWEDAVAWYCANATAEEVRENYFDTPQSDAVHRFRASREFRLTRKLLGVKPPGMLLDVGAGSGVASAAFALDGWSVTAAEPDPSETVGRDAITALAESLGVTVTVTLAGAEALPVDDACVDVVYGRQVLHHVQDLAATMREAHRVLRPGGRAVFVREHVAETEAELAAFLKAHPLHARYGGENALPLAFYRKAAHEAGFAEVGVIAPLASSINAYPNSELIRHQQVLKGILWPRVARRSDKMLTSRLARAHAADGAPGRMYSFVWAKSQR